MIIPAYRRRPVQRLIIGALALVIAAGVTACTSGGGPSHPTSLPSTARTHGPDTAATPPPKFSGIRHPLPSGAALKNDPNLYKTIRLTDCGATGAGWKAVGTAHNPTRQAIEYRIVVVFTDAQARAIDSADTTLTVPVGRTREWTGARKFKAPDGTRCVVRAVRRA